MCICVLAHTYSHTAFIFIFPFFPIYKPKEKIRWCDHHVEPARSVTLISSSSHPGMRLKASYKCHEVSRPVLHLVDLLWYLWLASCCLETGFCLFCSTSLVWHFLRTVCLVLDNPFSRMGFHFLLILLWSPWTISSDNSGCWCPFLGCTPAAT